MREASSEELALAPWHVHRVDVRRRPVAVACLSGELLITCEGDPEDHIVASGQALRVARRGRVVVAALQVSQLRISHE